MNKIIYTIAFFIFYISYSNAQVTKDYAVPLSAITNATSPAITMYWTATTANYFSIYKKNKNANSWNLLIDSLAGSTRNYTDTNVILNQLYDYKVVKYASGYIGYGYICSGIEIELVDYRGILILLMDSLVASMTGEINNYSQQIEADGWKVKKIIVGRYESVISVKSKIVNTYLQDPINTRTLFILGHVPVPYSGNFTVPPDGHSDHIVAWSSDAYYGDMDAIWDDISVNNTTGSSSRNHNIPGDEKFDYSTVPTEIELEIGRVDFSDLSYFLPRTDIILYKNYFDKAKRYRNGLFNIAQKAIIDDNFGTMSGEAFASTGWKSFAPIVNDSNIIEADLTTECTANSYMYSYGCGPGSYTTCGGVATSNDLASDSLRTVFNMLFGSYFGDWDSPNNLMRSMIAQGSVLTTCWSGRPHWYLHHLAMGENIGYAQKLVQNNTGLYYTNIFENSIHIALMGDPTLRAHMISPPINVNATYTQPNIVIAWDSISNEEIIGYVVYKKNKVTGIFERISDILHNTNRFIYPCVDKLGIEEFMVKSVRLEIAASGTYYNASIGKSDTTWINTIDSTLNSIQTNINTNNGNVTFQLQSNLIPSSYNWNFGDGNSSVQDTPTHQYLHSGQYQVQLIVTNDCWIDTIINTIDLLINHSSNLNENTQVSLYPNPTKDNISIISETKIYKIEAYNIYGSRLILPNSTIINLSNLDAGTYLIKIELENGKIIHKKLIKY